MPSLPMAPAVEETATTLWMQIMFPIAPPAICSAMMEAVERPSRWAVWNCSGPNRMPETVQDPETNAPSMPRNGDTSGNADPMPETIGSLMTVSMSESPELLRPEPSMI